MYSRIKSLTDSVSAEHAIRFLLFLGLIAVLLADLSLIVRLATGITLAALILAPRRRPRLSLTVIGADQQTIRKLRAPWPFDPDRIISNERARLDALAVALDKFRRTAMFRTLEMTSISPGGREHDRAAQQFAEQLETYETELRSWLEHYRELAAAEASTFTLNVVVHNAQNWSAHGRRVRIEFELPKGIDVAPWPTIEQPPTPPDREPPKRRSLQNEFIDQANRDLSLAARALAPFSFRKPDSLRWQIRDGGRIAELIVSDVYVGRSQAIEEPLRLRCVQSPSMIRWTVVSTESATRSGSFVLEKAPPESARKPFGRLTGLLEYPDVAIVDEQQMIVRGVREADPPLKPPTFESTTAREVGAVADQPKVGIRRLAELNDWQALGLDPLQDDVVHSTSQTPAEPTRDRQNRGTGHP